eukprot:jgi/Botrbrau1/17539/Bobra.0683s0002.2
MLTHRWARITSQGLQQVSLRRRKIQSLAADASSPMSDDVQTYSKYKYVVPEPTKDCSDSANEPTQPCRLWKVFAISEEACQKSDQWCQRKEMITVMQAKDTSDHYLVVPNTPNMGLEDWQRLGEDFWNVAWQGVVDLANQTSPSWDLNNVALAVNPSAARTQHQFHAHVEALLEKWRGMLDSRNAPSGYSSWPNNTWVEIQGDKKRWAYLYPDTASADKPGNAQPFQLWNDNKQIVNITGFGDDPMHAVGLLVTRDPGGAGWFVVLTAGSPEYLIYHDKGVVLDDGTPETQGGRKLHEGEYYS